MTWVAVAIGGSALIGAGASYIGSKKQSDASKAASNLNMEWLRTMNAQQQPFIQSGYGAQGRLNTLLGLNPRPPSMPTQTAAQGPQLSPQIQAILASNSNDPMSRVVRQVVGGARSQGQSTGSGYMPTAGGGVRPIMQQGGGEEESGSMPASRQVSRMKDLLGLRASNGDRQAQAILQRMV